MSSYRQSVRDLLCLRPKGRCYWHSQHHIDPDYGDSGDLWKVGFNLTFKRRFQYRSGLFRDHHIKFGVF
jgi:hypothetical protein